MSSSYELRLRVFLLSLEPAVRLASALRLDLDEVRDAVAAQYVLHFRDRGLSLEQIARRVGKSRRTIVTLSRSASRITEQLEKSREMSLRRAIVQLVSSRREVSVDEVNEQVGGSKEAIRDAIEALIEDAFLRRVGEDQLALARSWLPFDGEAEAQRLDSVRHFLAAVTEALRGRFFAAPPAAEAFARVLTFNAPRGPLAEAQARLFSQIRELAIALDEAASPNDPTVTFAFCSAGVSAPGRSRSSAG